MGNVNQDTGMTFHDNIKFWFDKFQGWGHARNIIKGSAAKDQFLKLVSENGELGMHLGELANGKLYAMAAFIEMRDLVMDDVGDNLVVIAMVAAQMGVTVEDIFVAIDNTEAPLLSNTLVTFSFLQGAYGKIADGISKNDIPAVKKSMGDAVWLLREIANDQGVGISNCAAKAWEDIKDRKGVMYNGVFVKSTDARYPAILVELGLED